MCGVARLARFNATVAILTKGDKVSHFEGFPIPSSLLLVFIMLISLYLDFKFIFNNELIVGLHHFSICFVLLGSAMISRSLKINKL